MRAPMPPALPYVGHLRALRTDMLGSLLRWGRDFGPLVRLQFLRQPVYLLVDPEGIKRVLQDNHRNYQKQTRGYKAVRLLLGNGLLTSEGDLWLRQRRIAQPAFKREPLAALLPAMDQAAKGAAERLDQVAVRSETVDIHTEMTRLTLRIVSETLLGRDISGDADAVGAALAVALAEAEARITGVALPLWVPTPRNRRLQEALGLLHRIVDQTIEERRARGAAAGVARDLQPRLPGVARDLLALLMDARDEQTGQGMTDAQLHDEVLTMFLAGHETTANQLTWTLYLLAQEENRAAAQKLTEEHHAFLAEQGDRPLQATDLRRLRYSDQVLRESMRLYPPAWIFSRAPTEEDELCGFTVEAGSWILISPYMMHRLPKLWPEPERFLPERFAGPDGDEGQAPGTEERPRYAYFPFGGGPRLCIGQNFAMMESLLLLLRLWPRYRYSIVPGQTITPLPQVTLRPVHGIRLRLQAAPAPSIHQG